MKNIAIAILSIISLALAGVLISKSGGGASELTTVTFEGDVIAKADSNEITSGEIIDRIDYISGGRAKNFDLGKVDQKGIETLAKEVAVQKRVLDKALESGIQNDPELKSKVAGFLQNVYKEKFLENIAKGNVNDEKLQELYKDLTTKAKNSKQLKVSHILVKTEEEAKAIKEKSKTQRFDDLARLNSMDKASAKNGGDLGFVFPEEFVPEFSEAAKKLKDGEISNPVKTDFGWHIIKVDGRKDADIVPFEQAKPRLEKQLGSEAVKEFVDGLSKDITVEIVKMPEAAPAAEAATEENAEAGK